MIANDHNSNDAAKPKYWYLTSNRRRSTIWLLFSVACIWLLGLFIANHAPEDILIQSSIARSYVDFTTWCWPRIEQYAQKSKFPQVALLYNAVIWIALPMLSVLVWRYLKTRQAGLLVKQTLRVTEYFVLIVACLFYAAIGVSFLFFWNGSDVRIVNFATSRQSLGIFGMGIPLSVAAFLTPVVAGAKKILTGTV